MKKFIHKDLEKQQASDHVDKSQDRDDIPMNEVKTVIPTISGELIAGGNSYSVKKMQDPPMQDRLMPMAIIQSVSSGKI